MFLRNPRTPREFGVWSSIISSSSGWYSAYQQKSQATKARRLQRSIATQQLALEQRRVGMQEQMLQAELQHMAALQEIERIKMDAMLNAPSMETPGAVRIDPEMLSYMPPPVSTIPVGESKGYYYEVPIEDVPTGLLASLGIPEKIAGIPTEYLLMGGGLALLVLFRE